MNVLFKRVHNVTKDVTNELLIVRNLFCICISSKVAFFDVFRNFTALFCRFTRGWTV